MAFIALTTITLNKFYYMPAFWFHAYRSYRACIESQGIMEAKVDSIRITYSTITLWHDKASMLKFISHPNHIKAMKWSKNRTYGKTFHYEGDSLPSWVEARDLIEKFGRVVYSNPTS